LTAAGVAFVDAARIALADTDRAMARARSAERQETDTLRLGLMPCPTLAEAATEALRRFREHHPFVRIDIVQVTWYHLFAAIRDGTIDIAIGYVPPDQSGPVVGECVWERPLGVVLPAAHRLATREELRWRDLIDLPLITFARDVNPASYESLIQAMADRGLKPRLANVHADGPPILIGKVVAEGEAWTLATEDRSWPLYTGTPGLVFRSLADPPIIVQQWNLWLAGHFSPLVRDFESAWDTTRDSAIPRESATVEPDEWRDNAKLGEPQRQCVGAVPWGV